ncbi:MAG: protease inhibitor I42 family protein [Breznakibacter sp.]|nr:protease inhibitor I42 family protein [Breznakibacter sp.]
MKCGVPGTENWVFKGIRVGTDTLNFSYVRPFEVGIEAAKTKQVIIHVYGLD